MEKKRVRNSWLYGSWQQVTDLRNYYYINVSFKKEIFLCNFLSSPCIAEEIYHVIYLVTRLNMYVSLCSGNRMFWSIEYLFSHIHRVIHTICPEWPACHPQGGGWQATRPVSRVKLLWRHMLTRRNGNVVRLDSSIFGRLHRKNTFLGHIGEK